ncbi:MAG: hypothetical protein KGL39_23225 [Patescibacteria group bacterium]|nr:hypothetical protein [Patescibacteria group bacterium]
MQIVHDRWIPWRLGIDVGVKGCVAAYNAVTKELRLFELPYRQRPLASPKGKRKFESVPKPEEWLKAFEEYAGAQVIIEDLAALAGHYAYSEAQLMESFGMIQMACVAHRLTIVTVHPTSWKAFMFRDLGGMRAEKSVSVEIAKLLWPAAAEVLLKTKDGRADALNLLCYDLLGERQRMEMKAKKQPPRTAIEAIFTGLNAEPLAVGY